MHMSKSGFKFLGTILLFVSLSSATCFASGFARGMSGFRCINSGCQGKYLFDWGGSGGGICPSCGLGQDEYFCNNCFQHYYICDKGHIYLN